MKSVRFILVVWGEEFIQTLCEICIPSLLAPGNIPYFSDHFKCKFHIITDASGKKQLEQEASIQRLRKFGEIIIDSAKIDNDHKYKQMSDLQNIGVRAAYKDGDGLGFLFVDGIWARDSFKEFVVALNQGFKAVGSWNMRSNKSDMIQDIKKGDYLCDGVLEISSLKLANLILKNLHKHMRYRFWAAEPSEEHCGQLFHLISEKTILIHSFLIIPYVIFPDNFAEIPPTPSVKGVSNTYMDIFLAQAVLNTDEIYIAQDSRTHLNVELSPPDFRERKRRANTARDYVLWAEVATSRQNREFFRKTITLTGEPNKAVDQDPTLQFVSDVVAQMDVATKSLALHDWRRLHKRSLYYTAKNSYVPEFNSPLDRLLLSLAFRIIQIDDYNNKKFRDGGLASLLKQKYFQRRA